jgi:hypothetical protein
LMERLLPFLTAEMRISDIIIIYLAIGSPFAVHYFLKSRRNSTLNQILHTALPFFLWPGYAISVMVGVKLTKDDRTVHSSESVNLDARLDKKVDEIAVALEMFFNDSLPNASLLEFREVADRYVGLTLAIRSDRSDRPGPFSEVVRDSKKNAELNSICLNRRNRKGLESHRNRARTDFLGLVSRVVEVDGAHSAFVSLASELTRVMSDSEASREIDRLASAPEQIRIVHSVNDVEREVWQSPNQKQSAVGRI